MPEWGWRLAESAVQVVLAVGGLAAWALKHVRRLDGIASRVHLLEHKNDPTVSALDRAFSEHEKQDDERFDKINTKLEPIASMATDVSWIKTFTEKEFEELSARVSNHATNNTRQIEKLNEEVKKIQIDAARGPQRHHT